MTFGRHWIAAAVCLPLLGLGGCSEDPEPIIDPPVETSSAADPTPTPEAKEPWEKKTDAGAVAFAEHWIEVFSQALRGGETDDLLALSAAECRTCGAFAERIDTIRERGGFYRTPGWRVLQAAASKMASPPDAEVAMRVLQGRETFKEAANSEVQRNPASRASYSATLRWADGEWLMEELTLL